MNRPFQAETGHDQVGRAEPPQPLGQRAGTKTVHAIGQGHQVTGEPCRRSPFRAVRRRQYRARSVGRRTGMAGPGDLRSPRPQGDDEGTYCLPDVGGAGALAGDSPLRPYYQKGRRLGLRRPRGRPTMGTGTRHNQAALGVAGAKSLAHATETRPGARQVAPTGQI